MDEQKLVTEAGGPSAQVSVVEKSGKAYILTAYETGETDMVCEREGEWILYALGGSQI